MQYIIFSSFSEVCIVIETFRNIVQKPELDLNMTCTVFLHCTGSAHCIAIPQPTVYTGVLQQQEAVVLSYRFT